MAYQESLKKREQAARQMEHHSDDLHPELANRPVPGSADRFVDDSCDDFRHKSSEKQNGR